MNILFNTLDNKLFFNQKVVDKIEYKTMSNDNLIFKLSNSKLIVEVPFFLLENIFFKIGANEIQFFTSTNDISIDSRICLNNHNILNSLGFIPHGGTQFKDVFILCSYLNYSFDFNGLNVKLNLPPLELKVKPTISNLYDVFSQKISDEIEKRSPDRIVLPLSGGMDSRLILDTLIKVNLLYKTSIYTHGIKESGDVCIAKTIIEDLGLSEKFYYFDLEELSHKDLMLNYERSGYLNPLDRLLTLPLERVFEPSLVISGLYGDVIFSDNWRFKECSYTEYLKSEGIEVESFYDKLIVAEYDKIPRLPKLYQILLRAQKLTRMSFTVSRGFQFYTPFVDLEVVYLASKIEVFDLYPKLIRRKMNKNLKIYNHQSSLTKFHYVFLLRKVINRYRTLLGDPYMCPYFDDGLLRKIGVVRNFAPLPNGEETKSL
jgi:hypothetical protein